MQGKIRLNFLSQLADQTIPQVYATCTDHDRYILPQV